MESLNTNLKSYKYTINGMQYRFSIGKPTKATYFDQRN